MAQLGGIESAHGAGLIGALIEVALIDLTLASDNAVAVGMAAAGLPRPQRTYAITLGLGLSVVLLCTLAFFAVRLLKAGGGGLVIGGGLLLLLVSWQMYRDLRAASKEGREAEAKAARQPKTLMRALTLIFIADVSTSLDNVLAVAGAVRGQPAWVLFAGLALSVALTGLAAAGVARLMHRWPWLGYIGLVVVVFVAGGMLFDGARELGWIRV
ncbi:MAG TPA: YjbE family putative metal transport protein [Caulobacteraceae bacterium]|nr:YjbE family putative metal transport protein [Caulobacteraceae bacterium]